FFSCYRVHQDLHSFPTRRSSDLASARFQWLRARPGNAFAQRSEAATLARARASASLGEPRAMTTLVRFAWLSASACQAETSAGRSEEHTSELQSRGHLVCRLLLE